MTGCRCSVIWFPLAFVRVWWASGHSKANFVKCVTDEICENEIRVCFRVFCAFSLASRLFFFCVMGPGALYGLHREVFVSSLSCRLISQGPVLSVLFQCDGWS